MDIQFKTIALAVIGVAIIIAIIGFGKFEKSTQAPVVETKTETPVAVVTYTCADNKAIQAAYFKGENPKTPAPGQPPMPTGRIDLLLSDGRSMALSQTISGSGIRYANSDESIVFWSKGETAFMTEGGKETYSNCSTAAI